MTTAAPDISWSGPGGTFNLRVAAVIITCLIAVDTESGEYVGLVRVWNTPGRPRLGLIGVVPSYRRRGLATLLLARVFRTLRQQDKTEVTAEVDDANAASRSLLLRLGARRKGGFVEVIKRQRAQ